LGCLTGFEGGGTNAPGNMSKAKTAESDTKAAKKKPAPKKPAAAAKKPAAKKPAPKAKKPAPKPAPVETKEAELPVEAEAPTRESLTAIEDAEIIAETPMIIPDDDGDDDEPAVELSEEEKELAAIYGDDLSAPAPVHSEYQDKQTKDEDRPMMPEINAREERKAHWQDRRAARRARREERDRGRPDRGGNPPNRDGQRDQSRDQSAQPRDGQREQRDQGGQNGQNGQNGQRPNPPQFHQPRPVAPMQVPVANGHEHDLLARVGTPLGDAAASVFAQLRNGQPLPVRQLAAMMRKRNLIETDPEQLAPQLKAELLGDERSYRTLGLRPRIVYRGRDLFAPGPVAMSVTADAEAGFAAALSRLAGATHRALSQRLTKASPAGFERLIHAYLVAAGYKDIAWVKRIGGISYASATAPGIDRTVLISARSGDTPIDRRGIGELRVGVEAKNLVAGILMSASELSEDAERELERAGRSISVICGDHLVATLIAAGVGVVSAAAPLHYVDDQLLDELLAG